MGMTDQSARCEANSFKRTRALVRSRRASCGSLALGSLGLPDQVAHLATTTQEPLGSFHLLDLFDILVDLVAVSGLKRQIE